MIYGYPEEPSLRPGARLALRVSTDAPTFRVEFYRCAATPVYQGGSDWLDGWEAPVHLPFQDWSEPGTGLRGEDLPSWPAYEFEVPVDWPPGVYVAVLVEPGAHPVDARDSRHGTALFVLRGSGAPILYKLPLFTYHAYNQVTPKPYEAASGEGGWCLYTVPTPGELPLPVPPTVNLHRPGGGTGGTPWDHWNFDPFDPSPRQTFRHWDAPFIAWLETSGYRVDYCTDLDLHRDATLLDGYRLLVSAGHDEYWSDAMRRRVERFVHDGYNAAFFGGNACWWRIEFDDDTSFRRVVKWSDTTDPENTLTGVSFRNGGERDLDKHPIPVGFQVQHADHWVYEGTGVVDGDRFGDRPDEYIVGYECDGAHFDRGRLARGLPVRPTGDDGSLDSFTILGVGDVSASGWGHGNKAATMGLHGDRGTVFTAATTDWARVLDAGASKVVDQVTRNVLDRLS